MRLLVTTVLTFLFGCKGKQDSAEIDYRTLDCGPFTMQAPKNWTVQFGFGTFSAEVGNIIIGNQDTLSFDIGWSTGSLTETDSVIMKQNEGLINKAKADTSNVDSYAAIDLDKFRKNNISWDTIDGKEAKIIYPRQSDVGTTGIYFKSIGDGHNRLILYGENLNPKSAKLLLQAFKTIKFLKSK